MTNWRITSMAMVLLAATVACSVLGGGEAPEAGPDGSTATPAEADEPSDEVILPVSINQGLASLDSYRMTYTNDVYDSVADERSVITFTSARDANSNATYTSSESLTTTEDYQVITSDIEEQYVIGSEACILQAGEAQFTAMSDMAREVMDLFSRAISINPIIENPAYAGDDVISGVPVRTYTFEITSIGATSESEVGRADGHYAVAIDGNYLVDYRLDMELRTGPEGDPDSEYSISFFEITLDEINQPADIAFPEACQQASLFSQDEFAPE